MIGKSCKYIFHLIQSPSRIEIISDKNISRAISICTPSQKLFYLSTSKNSNVKVNQPLFCKVNIAMLRPRALNCDVEPKLVTKDVF